MVSNKARKRVPPSRIRYEKQNPTLTIRLDRASYDKLKALQTRTGRPLGSLVKEALQLREPQTTLVSWCQTCGMEERPDAYCICPDCIREFDNMDELNGLIVEEMREWAALYPGSTMSGPEGA